MSKENENEKVEETVAEPKTRAKRPATSVKDSTPVKDSDTIEEGDVVERASGIKVKDINIIRPKRLPLIVELPEGASKAQQALAKIINGYVYQFPDKWEQKKEDLLLQLERAANVPDPIEDENSRLTLGTIPKNVI